jgi:hypothetical protein
VTLRPNPQPGRLPGRGCRNLLAIPAGELLLVKLGGGAVRLCLLRAAAVRGLRLRQVAGRITRAACLAVAIRLGRIGPTLVIGRIRISRIAHRGHQQPGDNDGARSNMCQCVSCHMLIPLFRSLARTPAGGTSGRRCSHLLEAKSWALGNAFQEPETRECSPPSQDTSTKKSGFSLRGTDGGRLRAVTYQGRRED